MIRGSSHDAQSAVPAALTMAHFGHAQRPFVSALSDVPPGVDGGGGGAGGDDVTVTSAASELSEFSPNRKKDAFCDNEANNEGRSGGGGGGGGGGGPMGPSWIRRTGMGVASRPEGSSTSTGRCLRDFIEGESKGRCWGDIGGALGGSKASVNWSIASMSLDVIVDDFTDTVVSMTSRPSTSTVAARPLRSATRSPSRGDGLFGFLKGDDASGNALAFL